MNHAAVGIAIAAAITASANHGLMMNKIRPTTTPAIPHFMCGDMLTPFTYPGLGPREAPGQPGSF
jgi:hypothetical protein